MLVAAIVASRENHEEIGIGWEIVPEVAWFRLRVAEQAVELGQRVDLALILLDVAFTSLSGHSKRPAKSMESRKGRGPARGRRREEEFPVPKTLTQLATSTRFHSRLHFQLHFQALDSCASCPTEQGSRNPTVEPLLPWSCLHTSSTTSDR
jgi:hypothetical protein